MLDCPRSLRFALCAALLVSCGDDSSATDDGGTESTSTGMTSMTGMTMTGMSTMTGMTGMTATTGDDTTGDDATTSDVSDSTGEDDNDDDDDDDDDSTTDGDSTTAGDSTTGDSTTGDSTTGDSTDSSGTDTGAVGMGGFVAVGAFGKIVRSDDGTDWETVMSPVNSTFLALAAGEGRFVAGSFGGTTIISTNSSGDEWQEADSAADTIRGLAYSGDAFYAWLGTDAAASGLSRSDDGDGWDPVTLPANAVVGVVMAGGEGLVVVCGAAVAFGNFECSLSPDGIAWSPIMLGDSDEQLGRVEYTDGSFWVWTAAGANARLWTSEDGTMWTMQGEGPLPGVLQDASTPRPPGAFENGVYVGNAVSYPGGNIVYSSADAVTWTESDLGNLMGAAGVTDVVGADGVILIAGATAGGGTIWSTTDGTTIEVALDPSVGDLAAIAHLPE